MRCVHIDIIFLVCLIQILIRSNHGLPSNSLVHLHGKKTSTSQGNQSGNHTSSTTSATILSTIPSTTEEGTTIETGATTEDETLITIPSTTEEGTTIETGATTEEATLTTIPSTTEEGTTIETSVTTEEATLTTIPSTTEDSYSGGCDDNEQLYAVTESLSICLCSPKYYFNETTQKCELKYQWVKYTPKLINDTRLVVIGYYSESVYVAARLVYNNYDRLPWGILMNYNMDPAEIIGTYNKNNTKLEVLLVEPGYYEWKKSSNGKVEENAIEAGNIGDEIIYICRIHQNVPDTHLEGVMRPSTKYCFFGSEYYEDYDLLTYTI